MNQNFGRPCYSKKSRCKEEATVCCAIMMNWQDRGLDYACKTSLIIPYTDIISKEHPLYFSGSEITSEH